MFVAGFGFLGGEEERGEFEFFVVAVEFGGEGADLCIFVCVGDGFVGIDLDGVFDKGI